MSSQITVSQKKVCFRIRREYFDMIVAGTKVVEFRQFSDFWRKRLLGDFPKEAVFVCGKQVHRRIIKSVTVESEHSINVVLNLSFSEQGRKDLGFDYHHIVFAVWLGDVVPN